MTSLARSPTDAAPRSVSSGLAPWFSRRPAVTVAIAALLYVGVFALRLAEDAVEDPITLLFCLPIALLAVAFGLRVGVVAGVIGVVLLAVWVLVDGVNLSAVGWATRVVPMVLLGELLGDAADRLRRSEAARHRLEAAAQRHRDAAEINDSIVQRVAAAKWALEAGRPERALDIITDTIEIAQELVAELLRDDRGSGAERTWRGRSLRG